MIDTNNYDYATKIFNQVRQLAPKLTVMTGANQFVTIPQDNDFRGQLRFRVGRNSAKCNLIYIKLQYNDLYTIEFGKLHGMKYTIKTIKTDIFVVDLMGVFSDVTGFYLTL